MVPVSCIPFLLPSYWRIQFWGLVFASGAAHTTPWKQVRPSILCVGVVRGADLCPVQIKDQGTFWATT